MAVVTVNPNQNINVTGTTTFVGSSCISVQLAEISAEANLASCTANTAYNLANGISATANTALGAATYASCLANTSYALASSVSATANSALIAANAASSLAYGASTNANAALSQVTFAYNQANAAFVQANAAFNQANSGSAATSAFNQANAAFAQANAAFLQANTPSYVANSAAQYANAAFIQANAAFVQANSVYAVANNLVGIQLTQNTNITAASSYANSAFIAANSAGAYANSSFIQANLAFTEANSAAIYANGAYAAANAAFNAANNSSSAGLAYNQANAAFAQANASYAEANSIYTIANNLIGIELTQNTNITAASSYANSAFAQANAAYAYANTISGGSAIDNVARTQANTALTIANAAFAQANAAYAYANTLSGGGSSTGNTITLGSNTAGLLVSNAVSLTTSTTVTNGIALLNQILGKLVPNSPATFPSTYGTITINSLVGPYRMTNFTQQDNTGTGTASVAGGTSVSILRTSSYTTSSVLLINSQVGDVLTVTKNAAPSGTRTITAAANGAQYNTGTYGDLHIISNADYASIGAISYANFWYFANVNATGTVANGWNNVSITDTDGSPTSNATWYYDNNSPGTPTFSSLSIVPNSVSLTYSSTVPHYNSSTTFLIGANVFKLSGDTFPASNTFMTGSAGGAFGTPASNTYAAVGITYPLARNLYVSSGSVTVNTSASIISGFSSSSTGPSITIDNSYATGTQSFTTTLANTILYKTGTSSSMEETGFIASGFGTAVGSGNAVRIVNYDGGTANDTPAFTAGQTAFNSQTGTFYTTDATVVAAVLKNDTTNYSTGYLPPGPNLSSQGSVQYITLRMTRTSVSKFSINYTTSTGIGGIWCAMPGQTSYGPLNNWYSMTVDNSIAGGCALGGNLVPSSTGSKTYNCQFAGLNSSNATNNEILVRIRLNAGQSITALSFAASTV